MARDLHSKYPKDSYFHTYEEMIFKDLAELALKLSLIEDAKKMGTFLINLEPYKEILRDRDGIRDRNS